MRTRLVAVILTAAFVSLPALAEEAQRMTPVESDTSIFTTHDSLPTDVPKQPEMPEGVSPFQRVQGVTPETPDSAVAPPKPPQPAVSMPTAPAQYKPKIPFGRGEAASMPKIPSGPHATEAVPVVNVDAVEASEAAPPTPTPPEADPVTENPEEPTDLTSPMFEEETNKLAPRKIILRALNKVTAQSETIALKPGEKIAFGQLEITAVNCQVSAPTSQTDYAALVDISEKMPDPKAPPKPLFRGWMYASSPSITALEHPVYDVTAVECRMMPKAEEKAAEAKESGRKPGKKGKH